MITNTINQAYPKRDRHYGEELTRELFQSQVGRDAKLLVLFIAHTEQAANYKEPATFGNAELEKVFGFHSPKSLNNARREAVESGWLLYDRLNNRTAGTYWTRIPKSSDSVDPYERLNNEVAKLLIVKNGVCSQVEWKRTCEAVHVGLDVAGKSEVSAWIKSASQLSTLSVGFFTRRAKKCAEDYGFDFNTLAREATALPFKARVLA